MGIIRLTVSQELEPYKQRIEKTGVEFIWEIGAALSEAKTKVIELTGDKRAPGFVAWCDDELNIKKRTAALYMKAAVGRERDPALIWGNKKSGKLTSPNMPLPDGKYSIIYADPPWEYGNNATRANAKSHYPTMSIEKLCDSEEYDFAGLVANDAILFMWATPPLLSEIWPVFGAWGFEYKTVAFFWGKQNANESKYLGIGNYTRSNVEMCLIGKKGNGLPREDNSISNLHITKKLKHSEKPHLFRTLIEKMYGDVKRIELFARIRSPGWDVWGNEVKQEMLEMV